MYAEAKSAVPTRGRSRRSTVMSPGRKSGSMVLAMISTVISGTPRTNSMKITEAILTIGSLERWPRHLPDHVHQQGEDRHEERAEDGEASPEPEAEILVAAGEQDVGEHREQPEEIGGSEVPPRGLQPQQPGDSDRQEHE